MKVLVVEDDLDIAALVTKTLSEAKVSVVHISNGSAASTALDRARRSKTPFDALILDLTLPGMDGMDVLKRLRANDDHTPTLVLTARGQLSDRLLGLETGADDYLTKPFEPLEMVARVRAIAKRTRVSTEAPKTVGNLSFDPSKGLFLVDGAPLVLSKRAVSFLEVLFRRPGEPVSTDHLTAHLAESAEDPVGAVRSQVSKLRDALAKAGCDVNIKAVYGIGYQIEASGQ